MEQEHRLNDSGRGCTCKTYGCKKWKEQFVQEPGMEKRCKRCWTLASQWETEEGNFIDWCINCGMPVL